MPLAGLAFKLGPALTALREKARIFQFLDVVRAGSRRSRCNLRTYTNVQVSLSFEAFENYRRSIAPRNESRLRYAR
jgi:hypothetical protein